MKKILLSVFTLLFAFAIFASVSYAQQATTPIYSSGGPSGPQHRMPHDVAFTSGPTVMNQMTGQGMVSATVSDWINTPMTRMVCVEAFNTTSGAKTHIGCVPLNFSDPSAYSMKVDAPLSSLPTGTHNIVYTYQDSGGFWHQVTNTGDKLVTTTFTR